MKSLRIHLIIVRLEIKMRRYIFCQPILLIKAFLVTTLLFFGRPCGADTKFFKHPLLIRPDTISICFLPFQTPETASLIEAVRAPVSKLLIERDDFNYNFWFPSLAEAKEIYEKGFVEKEKFWSGRPRIDYWRNEDVQYLAYGTYSLRDNALVVELYFYDLRDQGPFYSPNNVTLGVGKRY